MKRIYEKEYKALMIAGTVITNKGQALRLIKKFNQYFQEDTSYGTARQCWVPHLGRSRGSSILNQ